MLYNEELKIDTDPFSDWPKAYYKERDPLKREVFIKGKIERLKNADAEGSLEDNSREEEKKREEERLSVLYERYPSLKEKKAGKAGIFQNGNTVVDRYMFSWLNILICGRAGIHFWNKKSLKKEVAELLDIFHLSEEEAGESLVELRKSEWESFASFWIETCVGDKSYSSTVFGFLRMSDESLAKKMGREIADAMVFIPRALGLEEKAKPLKEVFMQCYCKSIYQGEKYWEEFFK
jgi:hypothetical protein